jgi:hypothetical protein
LGGRHPVTGRFWQMFADFWSYVDTTVCQGFGAIHNKRVVSPASEHTTGRALEECPQNGAKFAVAPSAHVPAVARTKNISDIEANTESSGLYCAPENSPPFFTPSPRRPLLVSRLKIFQIPSIGNRLSSLNHGRLYGNQTFACGMQSESCLRDAAEFSDDVQRNILHWGRISPPLSPANRLCTPAVHDFLRKWHAQRRTAGLYYLRGAANPGMVSELLERGPDKREKTWAEARGQAADLTPPTNSNP